MKNNLKKILTLAELDAKMGAGRHLHASPSEPPTNHTNDGRGGDSFEPDVFEPDGYDSDCHEPLDNDSNSSLDQDFSDDFGSGEEEEAILYEGGEPPYLNCRPFSERGISNPKLDYKFIS